jgi:hypothetical protein
MQFLNWVAAWSVVVIGTCALFLGASILADKAIKQVMSWFKVWDAFVGYCVDRKRFKEWLEAKVEGDRTP